MLAHGHGQVAPGALQDAPHLVGAVTQPTGNTLGKVHGHQNAVDFVHDVHEFEAAIELVAPQGVEHEASDFADNFGQSVEKGRRVHTQVVRAWDGVARENRQGAISFAELFAGVRQEPGEVDLGVLRPDRLGLFEPLRRLVNYVLSIFELSAVHRPDGVGRETDYLPGHRKSLLPGLVADCELLDGLGANIYQVVAIN